MKIKDISLKNAIKLNEGITNTSYLIDNKYVYRDKKGDEDIFNKIKNEDIAIKKVAKFPFSEKVIDYDKLTGKKLSLYIEKTTRLSSPWKKSEFDIVAQIIKTIHQNVTVDFSFEPFKRLEVYKEKADVKIDFEKEKEIVEKAKELYKKYPQCFCHNDLVKGNILFKHDKAYLLDYEYSGNNIELFDIASFLSENNCLQKEEVEYFASKFSYPLIEIYTMINFENILWYYWALYSYQKENKEIFLEIAKEKLNNI